MPWESKNSPVKGLFNGLPWQIKELEGTKSPGNVDPVPGSNSCNVGQALFNSDSIFERDNFFCPRAFRTALAEKELSAPFRGIQTETAVRMNFVPWKQAVNLTSSLWSSSEPVFIVSMTLRAGGKSHLLSVSS